MCTCIEITTRDGTLGRRYMALWRVHPQRSFQGARLLHARVKPGVGALWLLGVLPRGLALWLTERLGGLLFRFGDRRRRIAERNLEPDPSTEPVEHPLLGEHFDRFADGRYSSSRGIH